MTESNSKFKKGDRVAFYTVNERVTGKIVGTYINTFGFYYEVMVESGGDHVRGSTFMAHEKQCRKLKKKSSSVGFYGEFPIEVDGCNVKQIMEMKRFYLEYRGRLPDPE